ncbi:MAG: glycoside hydrolase family 65 protein [Candidatus Dormibacteraeota bacterium]|uniref:Glycoside hydrolase family 65 protein n=1 Tax=Candidatus Amunia macphersoniae TaxID=3127014 RepID=A0A934NF63_9BACT|nr:glycoside hydrolase family 65 protein [Candidatus Dormibacteraeota bacterium]
MIEDPAFDVDPWCLRESRLRLDVLAQSESLFALSNGHIGLRGNLDEGEPFGIPGTYLNSLYELRPLPYAEAGYGYPESGQTIINVTNGKLIRLLVDDEPFDVRYGTLESHTRELDLRAGVLRRTVRWVSPSGGAVDVSSVRLVSFTQRAIAAICYEVTPVVAPMRVVVQSELVANEALPDLGKDPRVAAVLEAPLECEEHQATENGAVMVHRTKRSGLRMGAAMDHAVDGPESTRVDTESYPDVGRVTVAAQLQPGETLRIVKVLAYGWSSQRSRPAVHDQVMAALSAVRMSGWDGLLAEQRAYLDDYWERADVEVEGDAEIQQAVRVALFHVLQAGARCERRPIPAKGLTGPGYDGHVFWDTEMFVLPVLTLTVPHAAADVLRWRHATLDLARERAEQLGLKGAAFPWRTIRGQECSGYWPAGTAAFHIGADIAHAVVNYVDATGDVAFEREVGLGLLVETARLWLSLGHHDAAGRFRIDGVTGPDEYSPVADNNVYTNLMAQQNLRGAVEAAGRHRRTARSLGVNDEETAAWRDAAAAMTILYDERLQVHPQSEDFTEHAVWDFKAMTAEDYPLLLHFPYFDLYRKQVVKQADVVLAMQVRGDAFTPEEKARNFAYYERLTVRDSSLSACTQAVIAAEVGQLALAYDYAGEAALMDVADLEHNTRDGLHIASLAGAWTALVAGFGGMRHRGETLSFSPRLPEGISGLTFNLVFRGRRLRVRVARKTATYTVVDGEPLALMHHGKAFRVSPDASVRRTIPPIRGGPRPKQPAGRAPAPRSARR